MAPSHLEAQFQLIVRIAHLPEPEVEFRFHSRRRWRFDFAWPAQLVAVEIEGGVWSQGRHTRGSGFAKDCDKYNEAVIAGWKVLRFTAQHLDEPDEVISKLTSLLTC